jgi:hypothetical protein
MGLAGVLCMAGDWIRYLLEMIVKVSDMEKQKFDSELCAESAA